MQLLKHLEKRKWKSLKAKIQSSYFREEFTLFLNEAKGLSSSNPQKENCYQLLSLAYAEYSKLASHDDNNPLDPANIDKARIRDLLMGVRNFLFSEPQFHQQYLNNVTSACVALDKHARLKQILGITLVIIGTALLLSTLLLLWTVLTAGTGGLALTSFAFLIPAIQFLSNISILGVTVSEAAAVFTIIGAGTVVSSVAGIGGFCFFKSAKPFGNCIDNIRKTSESKSEFKNQDFYING